MSARLRLLVALAVGGALAAAVVVDLAAQPPPLLAPGPPLSVGAGSRYVFVDDINGDRRVDVVAARGAIVAVQLGDGRGQFAPAATTSLGSEAGPVALGDTNADERLDLAVAWRDTEAEFITTWLGDGAGGFAARGQPSIRLGPTLELYKPSVRFLDLNADGALDLVTSNERGPVFYVLLGDGRGRFAMPVSVPYHPARATYYSSQFADVDGDGSIDVVTSGTSGATVRLTVMKGDGRGGFGRPVDLPVAIDGARRVATLGDLNGDGAPDLVLVEPEGRALDVLWNDGRGKFGPAAWSPLATRLPVSTAAIADANRDEHTDLILLTVHSVAAPYESELSVLLGGGGRLEPAPGSPYQVGPAAFAMAAGDINGDDKIDFVTSSLTTDRVTTLLAQ